MAVRKIETTIALDGEQAFKQGLDASARAMRVLESEGRALAASFAQSGDAAAAATARQSNLRNQIAQQEETVAALERALRDSAQVYGENSKEADGWAIKLNNARTKLANLQKALDSTDREVEELGRDSQKAGTQLSSGIGEGAQEAEKDVRSLMETMQDSLDAIQGNTAVVAIKSAWDMASGAYNAVEGFVSGTVDYRRQLSFLELNAEENGFDFENIKTALTEVTALTGDASTSIEGLSNLLAVPGMDATTLEKAIDGLSGAVVRFPDTIKFESLADGLQETLASGSATGQFAELLSRMGVSVEDFNAALEQSPTAAGDLEIALAYMAEGGLNDVYQKWVDTNQEMQDAREQEAELTDALAGLAAEIEPIVTGVKSVITELVNDTTEAIKAGKQALHDWATEEGWVDDTTGATGAVDPWLWGTKTGYTESPFEIIDGKLVQKGTGAKEAGQQDGAAYAEGFAEGFDITLDMTGEATEASPWKVIGERSIEQMLEGIDMEAYYAEMEAAGKEGGEQLTAGFETGAGGGSAAAEAAGANAGVGFAKGILSKVSYVQSAAASLAAAAAARMTVSSGLSHHMTSGVLNIDGRYAGTYLAPYVAESLAVNVE